MPNLTLDAPLSELNGLGPRFLSKLKRLNIATIRDLLFHFPVRYEDWSETALISELKPGDEKTIRAVVKEINLSRSWRRRITIVEALLSDDSGSIRAVWFNQPYVKQILKQGVEANFAGKVLVRKEKIYLSNPTYELVGGGAEQTKHTGKLVPIYPETKRLTSKGLRFFIYSALERLEKIPEFLPQDVLADNKLPEINSALREIHSPENLTDANRAKRRFAFEELFLLQMKNIMQKMSLAKEAAKAINFDIDGVKKIIEGLPFPLTVSQKKSLWEILKDIKKNHPMNRLLQGDVGSGKTIVAGVAAIITAENYQVAFMTPTEILARQHYKTLTKFFRNFSGGIGLLVSKETKLFMGDDLEEKIEKRQFIKGIEAGRIKIVVGTHALIQKSVNFKSLALVIVDEQHRFGVGQRAHLLREALTKNKIHPHLMTMSATPIPRTLMLSIFGDLDLSIIDELPKGRKTIITKIVDPVNRDKAYAFIRGQVRRGRQVFVICPRIEPVENKELVNYKNFQTLEVKTVKEEYEKLSKKVFPDLRVALLHGKMPAKGGSASGGKSKEEVMTDFAAGKLDILVTTSVVEVGVDVPNATIMMIEGAEKFGLAQLYQFRGRVGRGEHQSFCFLFTESPAKTTRDRLEALLTAKNGFELAEKDLKFRGPGEFLGEDQTGIPDVAMSALQNPELIKTAREAAEKVLKRSSALKNYPELKNRLKQFNKEIHLE
ncbi:MAG: ATP-dependent DNA helicase RecG [Candidatus Colwellbacteria bacterium]|nr:ATP-dependent DNA helicase RecG [Candidatus Colwellbacteria bacterium]